MLWPFIATIVIVLVVSGIIVSASTVTGGAETQAKATKVVGEISEIAKGVQMYRMTHTDYTGVDAAELEKLGIISADQRSAIPAGSNGDGYVYDGGTAPADNTQYVVSAVYPNLLGYVVVEDTDSSFFQIRLIVKENEMDGTDKYAIEQAVQTVLGKFVVKNDVSGDGGIDVKMQ